MYFKKDLWLLSSATCGKKHESSIYEFMEMEI